MTRPRFDEDDIQEFLSTTPERHLQELELVKSLSGRDKALEVAQRISWLCVDVLKRHSRKEILYLWGDIRRFIFKEETEENGSCSHFYDGHDYGYYC